MGRSQQHREAKCSPAGPAKLSCAIYTRKSTEEGLEQAFNTLDAQREAAEAYVLSQQQEGWTVSPRRYDDGGYSGANMERPALKRLLADVQAGLVNCILVYKIDRLTRSLLDFSRIIEILDQHGATFVSITQQFSTTSSLGRLTLNILLSFAQFEREMIAERTRDKMSAARRKGKWVGGNPVLGYDLLPQGGGLIVNEAEAERVRRIYSLYLEKGSLIPVIRELEARGWRMKAWTTRKGTTSGGKTFTKNRLYNLLTNIIYTGRIEHRGEIYKGEHPQTVELDVWNSVQKKLNGNSRTGGRLVRNKYGAILRGILQCDTCDVGMVHTYTRKDQRLYRSYVCVNAHQRGWNTCQTRSVSAPEIEQAVVDQIRHFGRSPDLIREVVRQVEQQKQSQAAELKTEQRSVERDLKRLSQEMSRLAEFSIANGRPSREATEALADIHSRVSDLEGRLADIRRRAQQWPGKLAPSTEVEHALHEFDGLWQQMTPKEQERAVRLLVKQVRYDGRTGSVTLSFSSAGVKQWCGITTEVI
ncbi:MAG TPA: recombinase family protein [Bryobacteraceae bacterium]|nr:recombinase family protein [Bryobacteraceae bacterium]